MCVIVSANAKSDRIVQRKGAGSSKQTGKGKTKQGERAEYHSGGKKEGRMSAAPRSIWSRKGAVHIDATRAARENKPNAGGRVAALLECKAATAVGERRGEGGRRRK